jgi:2-(1,2-epoxy-1,2-dihydrophenyl)acetyl-CoA isomerase
MSQNTILTTRLRSVLLIELNRPDRLNAMNKEMCAELVQVLEPLTHDRSVRSVVLTGVGRGFCAGGDLGDIDAIARDIDVEAETQGLRLLHRSSLLLRELPQPTIAAVNGPCAGAGLSWACAADIRIAAESAVFRTSFVSAGLTGDFGGTWTLPRIVGNAKARELYLLNEKVRSAEALRIGLTSENVPDEQLRTRALELAERMADQAPLALAGIKANLNDAERLSFAELLDVEAERQAAATTTADCKEAAQAFLEKRDPVFSGT